MENLLWFFMVFLLAGLGYFLYSRKGAPDAGPPPDPEDSPLLPYLRNDPGSCMLYIGVPPESPRHWLRAATLHEHALVLEDGSRVSLLDARSYLVCNPGGEIIARSGSVLALPEEVYFAQEAGGHHILTDPEIHAGEKWSRLECGQSPSHPDEPAFCAITLVNISEFRIRVLSFARYARRDERWEIDTTTKGSYGARLFREWWNQGDTEWIQPGVTLCCPELYGGKPGQTMWAFHLESYGGEKAIIGIVRPEVPAQSATLAE